MPGPMSHRIVSRAPYGEILVAAAALLAESVLAILALRGALPVSAAIGFHLVVVAALAVGLSLPARPARDLSAPLLTLVATLAAGPAGALGAVFIHLLTPARREHPEMLAAWYERIALASDIDPVTRLCDEVSIGRSIDLSAQMPHSFTRVIEQGSLAERQAALGLIARRFHPDFVGALDAALKSPEPVVRVQAAAVAARVRGELKARVRAIIDDGLPSDPIEALERASLLEAASRSSLLDENDRLRAGALARRLRSSSAGRPLAVTTAGTGAASQSAALLADEQLRSHRYVEFRRLRRLRKIEAAGGYKITSFADRRGRAVRAMPARQGGLP